MTTVDAADALTRAGFGYVQTADGEQSWTSDNGTTIVLRWMNGDVTSYDIHPGWDAESTYGCTNVDLALFPDAFNAAQRVVYAER